MGLTPAESSRPDVSVVVPTRDRPASLRRCLGALERQETKRRVEIVVVDDGSREKDAVAAAVAASPGARLVRQEHAGPAAARNSGAREALASRLLFVDDDCEPAPDWVDRLSAPLESGADAAGGISVNPDGNDALAAASQAVIDHLVERAVVAADRTTFVASNNAGCRAEVWAAVPFDESFTHASEDRDWSSRVVAAGYVLVLEPSAIVLHRQQLTLRRFWGQHVRYGRGAYRFRRLHPDARLLERPGFYLGLLRRGFRHSGATGALIAIAQVATAVGFAREALGRDR